jgi:tetratricopeptide (TPR) repeat protein
MTGKKLASLMLLLLFCVVSTPAMRAQPAGASQKKDHSVAQQQEKDEPPRDGEEWFARAYKFHNSDRHPEAIEAFKHAIALGFRKATAMYNIACGYALINDKDNALVWLQRAVTEGFDQWDNFASDSDLDPLRTDPRFKKLRAGLPSGDLYVRDERGYGKRERLSQANYGYARLEREASQNGEEWAKVGARLVMLRDFERAQIALHKAVSSLGDEASNTMYNLACLYSLKGDRENGISWLEKSVFGGFDSPEKLQYDPDLSNIRSHSRFAQIQNLSNTLSLSQFRDNSENFNHKESSEYSKERWAPAIRLYESFVKSEPNVGRAWFNLGYSLHYSSEHARAVEAFKQAFTLGYHKPTSAYDIACAYSMLNQRDQAFEWLDRATKSGFNTVGDISWDHDLVNVRSDPRFRQFLEAARANAKLRHKME